MAKCNTPAVQTLASALAQMPVAPATPATPLTLVGPMQQVAATLVAAPAPTTRAAVALATLQATANPPAWVNTPIVATLPVSLVAKGHGLLTAKAIPAGLAGNYVTNGTLYQRARAHNLAWATQCATLCSAPGGATVAQMVAAGVGLHSVQAYIKRGWFVLAA